MRVRNKLKAVNTGKLRLSVHRSNKNISAQLIDDAAGRTLAAVSWTEADLRSLGKMEQAKRAGELLADTELSGEYIPDEHAVDLDGVREAINDAREMAHNLTANPLALIGRQSCDGIDIGGAQR